MSPDSRLRSSRYRRKLGLAICLVWVTALCSGQPASAAEGVRPPHSAIVPLRIMLQKREANRLIHVTEACTGTVIDTARGLVLTAWHCLDGIVDLTRPPRALINEHWHDMAIVASGGSMQKDWAVLQTLNNPISGSFAMPISFSQLDAGTTILASGYPTIASWENYTTTPNASKHCRLTGVHAHWMRSSCELSKGMSGGAVMLESTEGLSRVGVISAQDEDGNMLFVPIGNIDYRFEPP